MRQVEPAHQRRRCNVHQPDHADVSKEYKKAKNVEIDYVSKGSTYGIEQMTAKTIDFGCSDALMKKDQLATATEKGGDVPTSAHHGRVAVIYHVPNSRGTNSTSPAKCWPTSTAEDRQMER